MNSRSRAVLLLAAALVLGGALWWSWRGPAGAPAGSAPREDLPPAASAPVRAPAPPGAPRALSPAPSAPAPSGPPGGEPAPVAAGDGESWPLPEGPNPVPQENDPLEPEQPQTAAWRHEKLVRISELLNRDVARLEREREAARTRGNEEEARRLAVQLARHRARLGTLREETAAMAEAARREAEAR